MTPPCVTCELTARRHQGPLCERIYENEYWRVVHAFNTSLPGWLVVVSTRHAASFAELSDAEAVSFGPFLHRVSRALQEVTGAVKTYTILFAEHPEHPHVHFHVVPRMADMPADKRGKRAFDYLGVPEAETVPLEYPQRPRRPPANPTQRKDPMSLTQTISSETVEELIQRHNEPAWLADERRAALRSFEAQPYPTNRDEQWRYTELKRFSLDGLDLVSAPTDTQVSQRIEMRITDSDAEGVLVYKGGEVVYRDSKIKEAGVIFTDLRTALREHEELVKKHLYSVVNATQSKYTALGAALWQNGTFLFVPKNTEVELPLGAFYSADAGGLSAPRTLVVLEANAKATFIDEYTSEEFGERLFNTGSVELILGDGANLRYVSLQNWSRTVAQIDRIKAKLERNSRLESLTVSLGADAARAEVECEMVGPGSESEMLGLYFADNHQHYNQYTLQHHATDHAHSDLLFKGALRDGSQAVYSGMIKVDEGAQKTDAYQTNRNLLLDSDSDAVSIPQLEIGANDVRCSHGSTTSPVPEDQRFYLTSRGLSPEVAEHVLVTGFLHEVTSRVTLPKVAEYVERIVQAKLGVPGVDEKL